MALEKEHQLPERGGPPPPQRSAAPPPSNQIVLTQKNPPALAGAHQVSRDAVVPQLVMTPANSFRFIQTTASAEIHEFLFELKKSGMVFWVGAAVPKAATDFTRAQVYFHPTVMQNGRVIAADADYRLFKRGWVDSIQQYVPRQGAQFGAAGRKYPLIFPFMTMDSLRKGGSNMFADRPVETLNRIMDAIHDLMPGATGVPRLSAIGAASFSSGIGALRLFLGQMRSSGLVKEVIDFDSPFITKEPKTLTPSPGAVSKCFTQSNPPHKPMGFITVNSGHFTDVTAYRRDGLHAQIGWSMYHQAMITSVI